MPEFFEYETNIEVRCSCCKEMTNVIAVENTHTKNTEYFTGCCWEIARDVDGTILK